MATDASSIADRPDPLVHEAERLLLRDQNQALELAATGAPLDVILRGIARAAATRSGPPAAAAIFLKDATGARLHPAAGISDAKHASLAGVEVASQPIKSAQGDVLGTLVLYHDAPLELPARAVEVLQQLSHTAAVVITRHRQDQRHQEAALALRERELELAEELKAVTALHDLGRRVSAAPTLSAAAQETLDGIVALVGADMGTVQLYDAGAKGLRFVALHGLAPEKLEAVEVICSDFHSSCAKALATGARVVVEDFETDPAMAEHRPTAATLGYRAAQSTPLWSLDGEIVGMLTTHFRAPRRLSQRELRLIDLYARQAAHLLENARSDAKLREASRRKDEFLATLAHELRNPLAPIRYAAHCLKLKDAPELVLQDAKDIIERQVRHMARLVDDLLDVSRISRGRIVLRRERLSLSVPVASAIEACRPAIEAAGHTLTVDLPAEPLLVEGDVVRLSQIFANLLNNAAKYTPSGGRIDFSLYRVGGEAAVRVRDNGVGLPEDMLEQIFELFAQVDASIECSHGGLGIGLTLARRLVEMHGGRIVARSDGPGHGAELTVHLPLAFGSVEATAGGPRTAIGSQRVLIADDNVDAAQSLAMLLGIAGHEVRCAHDGLEAVRLAEEIRPSLVLLDIGMPRLNGYDVARRLRALPGGDAMLLLALTGWGQDEDKHRAREAGFDEHLTKPVDPTALMTVIGAQRPAWVVSTTD